MVTFVVSLIGGFSLGGTYALIALGMVLVFRATETFNFAHGELMLLPAFIIGYFQLHNTMPFVPALILALAVTGAVGALFYLLVLRRTTGLSPFIGLIATLGLAAVMDGAMTLIFGSNDFSLTIPALPKGVVVIFGARISAASLVFTVLTLVLGGVVAGVLRFTHLGTQVRAAGQNAILAAQGGIHVRRLYTASWVVAAILAGIAGVCYGSVNIVDLSVTQLALAAIPAIMLGGLDSIEGALVGGILIGIMQGFVAGYLGGQYLDVITYSVLLLVLLIIPQGLFGTKQVTRA